MSKPTATALAKIRNLDSLAEIKTFADAMALVQSAGLEVHSTEEFTDGFVMTDKNTLVGIPFLILDYTLSESKDYKDADGNPAPYAVIRLVTEKNDKCIVVDGSAGICKQIQLYASKDARAVYVPGGLIRSDYKFTDGNGNEGSATTFYLS